MFKGRTQNCLKWIVPEKTCGRQLFCPENVSPTIITLEKFNNGFILTSCILAAGSDNWKISPMSLFDLPAENYEMGNHVIIHEIPHPVDDSSIMVSIQKNIALYPYFNSGFSSTIVSPRLFSPGISGMLHKTYLMRLSLEDFDVSCIFRFSLWFSTSTPPKIPSATGSKLLHMESISFTKFAWSS